LDTHKYAALLDDLTCDDIIRCQKARRALVAIGHAAVPSLVKGLGSKKAWVRWESAKALGQIGDPASIAALIRALQDDEFDVRWLAAEGLVAIGKKAVVPLLKVLIGKPDSIWLREGAHHVFHDMDRTGLDGILQPVMSALEDMEPSLQVPVAADNALKTLLKVKGKASLTKR
jgi:hypothetical protein